MNRCEYCHEPHDTDECCTCSAPTTGRGHYPYLCEEHGYDAHQERRYA